MTGDILNQFKQKCANLPDGTETVEPNHDDD